MFHRATREKSFVKLALTGPSGSGKTFSALKLAFGLAPAGRIAFLDTENRSGELYAHLGAYDVAPVEPPYTVERYEAVIQAAVQGGYEVLIVDSLSHAWAGEGGLLQQKEALDARGGNQYTNWAPITKLHERLKSRLLHAPLHVIATMRSKTEYVVEADARGKSTPRKVGMAPVQRDGYEYEFTLVFDLAADHAAHPTKDRTGLFNGFTGLLDTPHGVLIREWLQSGAEPAAAPPALNVQRPSAEGQAAPESRGDRQAAAAAAPQASPDAGPCPDCKAPSGRPHATACPRRVPA